MEITIITSEHREGTYFDDVLWNYGKSDYPAAESIFEIMKKVIRDGVMPSGVHVYYLDDIPDEWFGDGQFPTSLARVKEAFQQPEDVAAKIAEAEALTGMRLQMASPVVSVYNELHWPAA